jgi:hypothetical protein
MVAAYTTTFFTSQPFTDSFIVVGNYYIFNVFLVTKFFFSSGESVTSARTSKSPTIRRFLLAGEGRE